MDDGKQHLSIQKIQHHKPQLTIIQTISLYQEHLQNRHNSDTIFKHFYQTQHKDTRFIPQITSLPHIHIDPKECNLEKNIQTNTPTVQTKGIITNLFNSEGIHIQMITI
jgi:hypothetical protein